MLSYLWCWGTLKIQFCVLYLPSSYLLRTELELGPWHRPILFIMTIQTNTCSVQNGVTAKTDQFSSSPSLMNCDRLILMTKSHCPTLEFLLDLQVCYCFQFMEMPLYFQLFSSLSQFVLIIIIKCIIYISEFCASCVAPPVATCLPRNM